MSGSKDHTAQTAEKSEYIQLLRNDAIQIQNILTRCDTELRAVAKGVPVNRDQIANLVIRLRENYNVLLDELK